jgi:hypothetical protein
MDKTTAIRLLPGTAVLFRGRRQSIMSVRVAHRARHRSFGCAILTMAG